MLTAHKVIIKQGDRDSSSLFESYVEAKAYALAWIEDNANTYSSEQDTYGIEVWQCYNKQGKHIAVVWLATVDANESIKRVLRCREETEQ